MTLLKQMIKYIIVLFAFFGFAAWFFSTPIAPSISQPEVPSTAPSSIRGAVYFEGAAFGGLSMNSLETNALPWRLATTALVMEEVQKNPSASLSQDTLNMVLARFGFLVNAIPVNRADEAKAPLNTLPLGMTNAFLAPIGGTKLLVSNLGCAACHAGVTYDKYGMPQPKKAWLGMPNTSINLEAYVLAVFDAMQRHIRKPNDLVAAASKIYPDMDWRETATLRWLVLPMVAERLKTLEGANRPLPFPNGVPGATNGVAALKYVFDIEMINNGLGDNGIVSIPELGDRIWRTSLLADGAYASPQSKRQTRMTRDKIDNNHLKQLSQITTFFTVPSMGVHPDNAATFDNETKAIFDFLAIQYEPQTFPRSINNEFAAKGFITYQAECSECHGTYEWSKEVPKLVSFPNWLGTVGTDTLRAETFTPALAESIEKTSYKKIIDAEVTGGYAAPPLTGVWASAPYLHNGSVPTIEAILSPNLRPKRFMLGGHALDYKSLGIMLDDDGKYPSTYQPFSKPVWYDTGINGQNNSGHQFGETLTESEKRNLIEFLKLL